MRDFIIINGENSRDYGLFVTSLPPIQIPQERVAKIPVPGRSGYLHSSDDSFESLLKPISFLYDGTNILGAAIFLQNAETITLSNEPDKLYNGLLVVPQDLINTLQNLHEFDCVFECDPEKRESNPQEVTGISGMTLCNPGNRKTFPTFEVNGTGTVVLTVGSQIVTITGMTETVIIDGDMLECYNSAKVNQSGIVSGDFPIIQENEEIVISWQGTATVLIRPNWRWVC